MPWHDASRGEEGDLIILALFSATFYLYPAFFQQKEEAANLLPHTK